MNDEGEVRRLLSSFSCEQDDDIQYFLENRAIEFEQLSKARTYLAFDGEQLQKQSGLDSLIIYGYISLAFTLVNVNEKVSHMVVNFCATFISIAFKVSRNGSRLKGAGYSYYSYMSRHGKMTSLSLCVWWSMICSRASLLIAMITLWK